MRRTLLIILFLCIVLGGCNDDTDMLVKEIKKLQGGEIRVYLSTSEHSPSDIYIDDKDYYEKVYFITKIYGGDLEASKVKETINQDGMEVGDIAKVGSFQIECDSKYSARNRRWCGVNICWKKETQ